MQAPENIFTNGKMTNDGYVATGLYYASGSSRLTYEYRRVGECVWTYDEREDYWATSCGEAMCFPEGTPKENNFGYCSYCGNKIKIGTHHE